MKKAKGMLEIVVFFLFMVGLGLIGCGTEGEGDDGEDGGGEAKRAGLPAHACYSYLVDLHGETGHADVDWDVINSEWVVMSGQITSPTAHYSFQGDITGPALDRGWVDVVDLDTNDRFRAQIDMIPDGFILTANPFGAATSYEFTCK